MKELRHILALSLMLLAADSVVAVAADIYQINALSESELMNMYTTMLIDGCRYADADWHTWSADPRGGYWGDGTTSGNSGTRAVTSMVLACGALLKYCESLPSTDRASFKAKSIAAIRFLTATHVTGPQTCIDGKKWGDSWGSAYCSGMFGWGAWLIWDDLDSALQADVQRVLAHEADRFLTVPPPSGPPGDTKAEENAWNQMGISIAARMFPSHEHASGWSEKTIEYAMNTLSVALDEQDNTVVDGKPVSEWVCTANLNPDFTLENHNIFHPSYMQCSMYLLAPSIMQCIYSGRPIPQGLTHHMTDVWGVFQSLLLPWGETAFPQGMDWELHNLPAINLFAFLATHMDDPTAAAAEKTIIQYMRAWQQNAGGSLTVPGSTLGFTRHSIQCEQVADAYLAHKLFGPATSAPAPAAPEFVRYYAYVQNFLHRTRSKLLSFSWKNKIMGMIVPIGAGHEGNPFFTVPITNGLIGTTTLTTGSTSVTDAGHTWRTIPNGGETSGTLLTNDGLLRQQVKVTSVGQQAVVYQDLVTATADVTVKTEQGISLGIENDSISGGRRIVYHKDGSTSFDWQSPKPITTIPGTWANVDGRLGIVVIAGSGIAYAQATGYSPGIAVYRDVLYGSYCSSRRSFSTGAQVARRTAILLTEVTPAQTAAVAQSATIVDGPNGQVLRFNLPEGGTAEVALGFTVPAITPDSVALPPRGTQQFALSPCTPPVVWQVINQSVPGVGTVDSNGLFAAQAVGTCQLRATDALGNSDESGVITVAKPTISPSAPLRVVRWKTVTFTFTPSYGVTWHVIDESGAAGTVGRIDSNGVFTAVGPGTCRVRAADSLGNTQTSALITVVSPGAYDYAPDANTVALYHLDEATGETWLDSSGNGINATASAAYPVGHVGGIFGNAAGGFDWQNGNASFLTTSSSTKLQNPEMTAECWVYFPPDVDIPAATADGSIRGMLGCRVGGNSWSLCAGSWPATPPYGVPGGVNFVYWGTPSNVFVYSTARVFYNDTWYHVAVTYKPLGTTPETYQTRIYVTPQGTTTPVLVAEATTPNRMLVTATGLYIGDESPNTARKFPGYIDEVRISNRARTQEELSWTLGGIAAPNCTIAEAKKQNADGAYVTVAGVVSGRFSGCSYLEAPDRSSGIRLDEARPLGLEVGDTAKVVGRLGAVDGERFLQPMHVEKTATLVEQNTSKGTSECTF